MTSKKVVSSVTVSLVERVVEFGERSPKGEGVLFSVSRTSLDTRSTDGGVKSETRSIPRRNDQKIIHSMSTFWKWSLREVGLSRVGE